MFCGKSHLTRYRVEFYQVWGYPIPVRMTFVVPRMFYGKSHVTCYGVEFDEVWGVPNPGVDDPLLLLGCFLVSRA